MIIETKGVNELNGLVFDKLVELGYQPVAGKDAYLVGHKYFYIYEKGDDCCFYAGRDMDIGKYGPVIDVATFLSSKFEKIVVKKTSFKIDNKYVGIIPGKSIRAGCTKLSAEQVEEIIKLWSEK